jgi:hypothetical protein
MIVAFCLCITVTLADNNFHVLLLTTTTNEITFTRQLHTAIEQITNNKAYPIIIIHNLIFVKKSNCQ